MRIMFDLLPEEAAAADEWLAEHTPELAGDDSLQHTFRVINYIHGAIKHARTRPLAKQLANRHKGKRI